jgi:hypothetical protein
MNLLGERSSCSFALRLIHKARARQSIRLDWSATLIDTGRNMDILDERAISVFTDGSSYSGPRRGGIGIRIITVGVDGQETIHDEQPLGVRNATNQQMELQACVEALRYLSGRHRHVDPADFSKIVIHTDSRYVVEGHVSASTRGLLRSG